jgi:hypothetical protein
VALVTEEALVLVLQEQQTLVAEVVVRQGSHQMELVAQVVQGL